MAFVRRCATTPAMSPGSSGHGAPISANGARGPERAYGIECDSTPSARLAPRDEDGPRRADAGTVEANERPARRDPVASEGTDG